jgi:hypothetical protein
MIKPIYLLNCNLDLLCCIDYHSTKFSIDVDNKYYINKQTTPIESKTEYKRKRITDNNLVDNITFHTFRFYIDLIDK